jgi:hypothetical protein
VPDAERKGSRAFLAALLAATAAIKIALAWAFPGFLSGDDVEVVETAARYAVELDYSPWPIRSLFHPLVLAFPVMKAGALAGLASPRWLTLLAALPTVAFSTIGIWLAYRVARELDAAEPTARAAAFLAATAWVPFAYGATPYPRPISGALLLAAFLLVVRRGTGLRLDAVAGALVAAAFAVRWSEGVAVLPLAGLAWIRERDVRRAGAVAAGFGAGVLAFVGVFDALTWGAPFASLRAFLAFMQEPHEAFTPRPAWWYAGMVLQWAGPILFLLIVFAVRDRRAREPLLVAAAFVALLSPTALKAMRYMIFAVLLLAVAAAFGWERLRRSGRPGRALANLCLIAAIVYGAERTLHLMREKSQPAVAAAQYLASLRPAVKAVALEQAWVYGERLYLGNGVAITDVPPRRPLDPSVIAAAARGRDAVAIYAADLTPELSRRLEREGFGADRRFDDPAGPPVVVFLRRDSAQNGQ